MSIRDIEWGEDEAKGDQNLANYFVEIPVMNDIYDGKIRYVIGRKGSGKSAIAEKIRIDFSNSPNVFFDDVSLKNFPVNDFRNLEDKSYRDKSKFIEAWKFVILMNLSSLILSDASCEHQESVTSLQKFIDKNFPNIEFGITKCITHLNESKFKVSIHGCGFDTGENGTAATDIHFSQATRSILECIKRTQTQNTYYLFFDELDEGYTTRDKSLGLVILALLRAVEVLSKDLQSSGIEFRPIVMLRSDIFERLHDNDLNKLDDYIVRLDWSAYAGSKGNLIDIVNARIRASLGKEYSWNDIAVDNDRDLPQNVESLWKYIVNRTYERPRDIIKFMKFCKSECTSEKLTFKDVKRAELKYSPWLFNELKDEMCAHLECYEKAVMAINIIGCTSFPYETMCQVLREEDSVARYCKNNSVSEGEIVQLLFDFSVLGTIEPSGRWMFKYKDLNLPFNKRANLTLHYGLVKKLRVKIGKFTPQPLQ
uniref:Uncharacterized protein n=1 Tax=Nitratidesulfovibrio vulgaris (strain DSM 19637 / Miyazaki F) TaxID=883 RepID=B8DL01_NITV9